MSCISILYYQKILIFENKNLDLYLLGIDQMLSIIIFSFLFFNFGKIRTNASKLSVNIRRKYGTSVTSNVSGPYCK